MEDEHAVLSTMSANGKTPLKVPKRDHLFVYTAGRAMHFWPNYNGNNAVWLEEDIKPLYEDESANKLTFVGTLVNLDHTIGTNRVPMPIGSVISEQYIPGVGVDNVNKIDRRQLKQYEVEPDEFASEGEYSKQSVEINFDPARSKFVVLLDPASKSLVDQRIYSAEEASALGIRRTSVADPLGAYYFENKYKVLEALVPRGVRGIAMLANPADRDAHVFDVAAGQEQTSQSGEKNMTAEELAAKLDPLNTEIATLRSDIRSKESEATALTDTVRLKDDEIAVLNGKLVDKDTEIARLNDVIEDGKKTELAHLRLAELAKVDGFEIKDEEKASLITDLAGESESDFKLRRALAVNTGLAAKIEALRSGKTDDENAGDKKADEHAGLRNLNGGDDGKKNIDPFAPVAKK